MKIKNRRDAVTVNLGMCQYIRSSGSFYINIFLFLPEILANKFISTVSRSKVTFTNFITTI